MPFWLKITLVFVPGTTKLPEIFPITLPIKNGATILPELLKLVNTPTLVIFGWLLVVTVPALFDVFAEFAYVALATLPTTFAPGKFVKPLPLPTNLPVATIFAEVIFPLTANVVNVPKLVILGWLTVVNTPTK